ncbi:MAG: RNA polymerase factor sigma-54 [Bdellovibrionaceae bacterium]|nr:RNA polymerase factor sigma-54 [Pseudobdellovibrionaceae bacterium]
MMAGLKMSMKLSQQLRMTPQLQQAIKLLQLSRVELEDAIRKELNENPILEEFHETTEDDAAKSNAQTSSDVQPTDSTVVDSSDPRKQEEFDWENYIENQNRTTPSTMGNSDEIMNYENLISQATTLQDHLLWQVGLSGFNEEEEVIARVLISYIDEDGWIKTKLEDIAREEEITVQDLEDVLPFVQEFDPPGVGARDLKECLLIQAKHYEEDTHDLVALINNHLKDLEKKNYVAIAKAMDSEVESIVEMCNIILSMDPKPGRIFMTQDTHYVTPDVYVYKVGEEYVVSLNEDGLPRLRVSNLYKNLLKTQKESKDKDTQDYIQEKLRSAVWLIKSIHQRQRTIYKVTESIVKHQTDFFEKGPGFIKPMILRDIANDIGMHESTVSRVTTSKFVHTPRGIFELKYFFNSGIGKTDGDSVASESVKLKIKDLVSKEDLKKPLSDQRIVELLKKDGIKIARRTVAKYRDMLKILPSSKRKKYF